MWFVGFLDRLYNKKIDSVGLSYFRIFYCLVLLCEIHQIYYFRHLIFDTIPFVQPSEIDVTYVLIVWMVVVLFLMVGLFTRVASLINYILSLLFFSTMDTYEYHMFYVYLGVNFLLMLVDVSRVNSIDRLIRKLKYSTAGYEYEPGRLTPVLSYFVIVFVAIAFVYFDSVFYKATSYNWTSGLGFWLPASLPQITHFNTSFILNVKWVSLALGYLTLIFETLFIFTFFLSRCRIPLLIIGLGLHLGIVIQFPIPWFGLGVISIYLLMVPVKCWKRVSRILKVKEKSVVITYYPYDLIHIWLKIFIQHFDVLNAIEFRQKKLEADSILREFYLETKSGRVFYGFDACIAAFRRTPFLFLLGVILSFPGIHNLSSRIYKRLVRSCNSISYSNKARLEVGKNRDGIDMFEKLGLKKVKVTIITFGLAVLCILQLNVTWNSSLAKILRSHIDVFPQFLEKGVDAISRTTTKFSKIFFGITAHSVFMDQHFSDYNHIIGLEAVLIDNTRIWLPINSRSGMPGSYSYSSNFVKWTFRVNSPNLDLNNLTPGLRDFSTFWAVKNGINLEEVSFNIYIKLIDVPRHWEYDFLNNQLKKEWKLIGSAKWENGNFVTNISPVD